MTYFTAYSAQAATYDWSATTNGNMSGIIAKFPQTGDPRKENRNYGIHGLLKSCMDWVINPPGERKLFHKPLLIRVFRAIRGFHF